MWTIAWYILRTCMFSLTSRCPVLPSYHTQWWTQLLQAECPEPLVHKSVAIDIKCYYTCMHTPLDNFESYLAIIFNAYFVVLCETSERSQLAFQALRQELKNILTWHSEVHSNTTQHNFQGRYFQREMSCHMWDLEPTTLLSSVSRQSYLLSCWCNVDTTGKMNEALVVQISSLPKSKDCCTQKCKDDEGYTALGLLMSKNSFDCGWNFEKVASGRVALSTTMISPSLMLSWFIICGIIIGNFKKKF